MYMLAAINETDKKPYLQKAYGLDRQTIDKLNKENIEQ